MDFLTGFRTYLMAGGVIAHQVLKLAGIDIGDELISTTIDSILGFGAIFFRWAAAVKSKKDVEVALHTPIPTRGGQ